MNQNMPSGQQPAQKQPQGEQKPVAPQSTSPSESEEEASSRTLLWVVAAVVIIAILIIFA